MDSERSRYRLGIFLDPTLWFLTTNVRFSAPELGREAPEPGRDAPVAHTAPLIGPACMLVPGDGLRRVQNIRDSVRTFIWLQNCDFQVKIRYFKFQNRGVSSPNRGVTPRLPVQQL